MLPRCEATADIGSIVGIDPLHRVPVKRAEVWMPASLAPEVLGRAPDVENPTTVSWGNLSRAQVSELIILARPRSETEDEALDYLRELFDASDGRELQWSLFYL